MVSLKAIQRYELKYLLHRDQAQAVLAELRGYVAPDANMGDRNAYLITSLYYDTPDYKAYWDKIDGHRFRRKVRVRLYGNGPVTPATPVFVEIKQRLDRALEKRRVQVAYQHAATLGGLEAILDEVAPHERKVLAEVSYLAAALQLQPACMVSYRRVAYNGSELDPGLRVTFDTDLKARAHDLSLTSVGYATGVYFFPPDRCVMEIKVNHRLPFWLVEILAHHNCVLHRISKYCTALETAKGVLQRQRIMA